MCFCLRGKLYGIPQLIEGPGEISCGFRLDGFCCAHDSVWLPQRRRSHGAYGAGARRVFALPGDTGANALVLLDEGWSCQQVAHALLLDDDTIRSWRKLFEQRGIEGITSFDVGGSASYLSVKQEDDLKAWVSAALPRSTRQIGAWIEKEFGLVYESRSGLIALLHRLGLEYLKPDTIPRKLDEEKQKAFIESYDKLLNSLTDNESVVFADAVHPTHAARPAGCWASSQEKLAIGQTSGRQRINIHGAIDLETGQTQMIEALTMHSRKSGPKSGWIKLHFIPPYCPHLNPIERLWGIKGLNAFSQP